MKKFYTLFFLLTIYSLASSGEIKIYVGPNGNDSGTGKKKEPFATLTQARDAVRKLRAVGREKDATVYILPGIYYITETIQLSNKDNNTKFIAETPGSVRLLGGIGLDFKSLPILEDQTILNRLSENVRKQIRVIDLSSFKTNQSF